MLRHYDTFVNYMIAYGAFHIPLLLQLLHRMLCDGQLFSSPLFPALPCRGPLSLWLSTELREMEVISSSSCVPLKHKLLGNWTSSQISAPLSLELPCDNTQKGLAHFRGMPEAHASLVSTEIFAWIWPPTLPEVVQFHFSNTGWEVKMDTCLTRGVCEASFRKALKCSKLLTPLPGWAPDCNS